MDHAQLARHLLFLDSEGCDTGIEAGYEGDHYELRGTSTGVNARHP